MVALVRKAGAIILCKTNVPEFGAGANTRNAVWGATGNPFDPRAQCRRLLGRLGGRARLRHAPGIGANSETKAHLCMSRHRFGANHTIGCAIHLACWSLHL